MYWLARGTPMAGVTPMSRRSTPYAVHPSLAEDELERVVPWPR